MSVFAVHLILLNIGDRIAFLKEVRYADRRDPFSQLPLTNHQAYLILLRSALSCSTFKLYVKKNQSIVGCPARPEYTIKMRDSLCYLTPENKTCQSPRGLPFSPSFTSKVTLQA